MKIIALEAENLKRIKAIRLQPDGRSVIIGGDNEEGKSSCLDAILYALAGKDAICDEPLRKGTDKGFTKVTIGEFVVERRLTKAGTTLTVTHTNGVKQASPQSILDALLGKLTFDPLAFSRMDAKAQRETLAKLVGIDFKSLNDEYASKFEDRRICNREVERLKALCQGKTELPGLPDKEIEQTDLLGKLTEIQEHNKRVLTLRSNAERAEDAEENAKAIVASNRKAVALLRQQLKAAEEAEAASVVDAARATDEARKARQAADAAQPMAESTIHEQLSELAAKNANIRENNQLRRTRAELQTAEAQANAYTKHLDGILQKKRKLVEDAKFPLPLLTITDDAVLYQGLPLQQASSARQIQISASIGMALNPKLRVMIIREGSLLDDKSLAALQELANANDFQLWIERVGKGKEISVVIEDGEVAENRL